jgi:hypothetical protein
LPIGRRMAFKRRDNGARQFCRKHSEEISETNFPRALLHTGEVARLSGRHGKIQPSFKTGCKTA